ncbi:MAG: hypothetical protein WC374_08530 [Phycisphaerae bacterium]|jgi:hypothetical protein
MSGAGMPVTSENDFESVIGELESLLKRQLDLARKGNIGEVETLAGRAGELIEQVSQSRYLSQPRFEARRSAVQQLYGEIALAVSAQMDEVSNALGKIHKGRKTITLYRENI